MTSQVLAHLSLKAKPPNELTNYTISVTEMQVKKNRLSTKSVKQPIRLLILRKQR